jgi:hypothetical protein
MDRRMMMAALVVVVGGGLTLALLMASSPAAIPATVPTNARPSSKPAPAPAAAAAVPAVSHWKSGNREWLGNNKKSVAFELRSENRVPIWQGVSQPMLVIRCESGRLQTFVYTASAIQMELIDENHTVRISFDGAPEVTERWADSDDHDALFAPDGAAFAQQIASAQTLRFGYTPHNAARAVAEFKVSGLAEALEPAVKPCGLKK